MPYTGAFPDPTAFSFTAGPLRNSTTPTETEALNTLSVNTDYLLAELQAFYAALGQTFYIEDYGDPVVGGSTGASANGTAIRAAAAAANAAGGGIIDSRTTGGWYLCDWADLYSISTTGNTGTGRTFCHVALGDNCVLGPNLWIKAAPLAGANGTIFNRHITNLNQTSGNKFCGYLPLFRCDPNLAAQATSGLGGTAGTSSHGDGSFASNVVDFTNCSDEVMKGGIFYAGRGTGSNTAGTTVASGSNGVDAFSLSNTTLNVAASTSFAAASANQPGSFWVQTLLGPARIKYTGKGSGTLTGCTYVTGGGVGSTMSTGDRLGSIETWVLRCQGTGDRHVITGNTVDGRSVTATTVVSSSGICAQSCTGATNISDNTVHHLALGNAIAINAGTGALNVRGNIVKTNGHSGISVENSDYFLVATNMVDGNGTDVLGGYGVVINGAGGSSSPGMISGNTIINTLKQGLANLGRGLLIQAGGGSANHINICGGNIIQNNESYGIDALATLVDSIDEATLSMMIGNNGASAEANFGLASAVNVVPGTNVQSQAGSSVGPTVPASTATTTSPYPFRTKLRITTGGGVTVTSISVNGQVIASGSTIVAASSIYTVPVAMESPQNGGSFSLTYSGGTPTVDAIVAP